MSLADRWDPLEAGRSWWAGSSEFDWWWERASEVIMGGDGYEPGHPVPIVIGEIPRSMEDLQREQRALEEQIANSPIGTGTLPPIDEEVWGDIIRTPVPDSEDDEVAHTWGHLAREFVGDWLNPPAPINQPFMPGTVITPVPTQPGVVSGGSMAGCEGMAWSGGTPPRGYKVVNYCGQGVLRKIRRRRRRRMLTASDASDLATIVGIVGKGQMASSMINRTRS